jgi:hypothetical protein
VLATSSGSFSRAAVVKGLAHPDFLLDMNAIAVVPGLPANPDIANLVTGDGLVGFKRVGGVEGTTHGARAGADW